jgi:uncharacterized protein (TIGR02246 family)
MQRYGWLVGGIGCLVLALGCGTAAVEDTREADINAVKDLEVAWNKDTALRDPEKWASYFAEDAAILMPNEPMILGKDKARQALKAMLADPNFGVRFEATRVEASKGGDLVYTIGTYTMTMSDPKDKKPMSDKGKYVTVYKKQPDGTWKAVADMINSDLPPPSAPAQ